MSIAYYSAFMSRPGHGGGHRWEQLQAIIESTRIASAAVEMPTQFSLGQKLSGIGQLKRLGFLHGLPSKKWLYYGGVFSVLLDRFAQERPKLIITETLDPHSCLIAAAAAYYDIPWIACPPNLDSLLGDFADDFYPKRFGKNPEFAWLALADIVFTISAEEAFVLNNADIPAHFLPYFPASDLAGHLSGLRSKRKAQGFYLILGSAINPPTKAGVLEQLGFAADHLGDGEKLIVVGRGTQQLDCDNPAVVIEGEVSDERLAELLSSCKAAWIHQTFGVGALTRIAELLLAGIPVVLSSHAARSASYDGIYPYESFPDALDALRSDLPMPSLPTAPSSEFFEQTIAFLCQ